MNIIPRLADAFGWYEEKDVRIGDVWLHPVHIAELKGESDFDQISSLRVREAFLDSKGALYVGMIFGARVFESTLVMEDHVVLVPDGLEAKLLDRSAGMSF